MPDDNELAATNATMYPILPLPIMSRKASFTRMITVKSKYYLHSRLVNKAKKVTTPRTTKHKTLTTDKLLP